MCNYLGYLKYSLLLVDSIIQLVKDNCTIACSPHHFFTSYTDPLNVWYLSDTIIHSWLVIGKQSEGRRSCWTKRYDRLTHSHDGGCKFILYT